jgi:hypothetical protein
MTMASDWHPIETAPKDGTEIVLLVKTVTPPVMAAHWYEASEEMGWWDARHYALADADVQSWQPLPAAE